MLKAKSFKRSPRLWEKWEAGVHLSLFVCRYGNQAQFSFVLKMQTLFIASSHSNSSEQAP